MFKELVRLKKEMDTCERDEKLIGNYNTAVMNYLNYGREYYDDPNLSLVELNRLFDMDVKFDGFKILDYYEQDETMSWVAANVFDDEHFGSAISDEEYAYRKGLLEEYADEIALAKVIVTNNPNFEAMTYKNKINYIANLLVQLHSKREAEDKMSLD